MKINREPSVDVLRGLAVVSMIIGHTIFFRYGLGNGFLNAILNFSNVFCYITFLYTFGVGLYYSIVLPPLNSIRISKIWKRIFTLLLAYYVTASTSIWSYYPINAWDINLLAKESWRIITFNYYAAFTEYIPSFILFTILCYIFKKIYPNKIINWFKGAKITLVLVVGIIIHLLGNYIAHSIATIPIWLRPIIGSPTSFDFPIMQYLLVVLLGMWTATWFLEKKNTTILKITTLGYGILVSNLVLKYTYNFPSIFGWIAPWINTLIRWPPTLLFLLNGLAFTFVFLSISRWMINIRQFDIVSNFLLFAGQRGMSLLIFHLLLLFIMKALNFPLFNEWQLAIFIIGIFISYKIGEVGLVRSSIYRYNINHEKN